MNKVIVTGRIISKKEKPDGSTVVTLASKNGKDTYPNFICRGISIPEEKRARVEVVGHVVYDKNSRHTQYFQADSIEKEKSLLEKEFGSKGKFFAPMDAQVFLIGELSSIKDDGDWERYKIKLPMEDGEILCSRRKTDRPPKIEIGDEVCTVCGISTSKKTLNGKEIYFTNLVIIDIARYEK